MKEIADDLAAVGEWRLDSEGDPEMRTEEDYCVSCYPWG